MRVRNKQFPYPILNRQKTLSTYDEESFVLHVDGQPESAPGKLILKNVYFDISSPLLARLLNEKKAKVYLVVESSITVYRAIFEIGQSPKDIEILSDDIKDKVEVSAFMEAEEECELPDCNEYREDYLGDSYPLEKHSIMAADDGVSFDASIPEDENDVVHSIFSVIPDESIKDGKYFVDYEAESSRKIAIHLPEKPFDIYKKLNGIDAYSKLFFDLFSIPALTLGLAKCRQFLENSPDQDILLVKENFRWFGSVLDAYKRLAGQDLDTDAFLDMKPEVLAQLVMGDPILEGLEAIKNNKTKEDDNDGD